MPVFGWLTKTQAVTALQGRLNNSSFWTATELWLYIVEGLRIWQGLTEQWNSDFALSANSGWLNMGTQTGSPRLRSVTDANLYTSMQYMLLEPPTGGGTWTGTPQFNLAALQFALQKRTQEVIQASACNLSQLSPINTTPGTRRNLLPDTVLETRRIRFLGVLANTTGTASSGAQAITLASAAGVVSGQLVLGTGIAPTTFVTGIAGNVVQLSLPTTAALSATPLQFAQPMTMTHEDTQAFQYFEPGYLQTFLTPQSWSVVSEPPLAFDVDTAPNMAGQYDVLVLVSGPVFSPPTPSLLGVPDDWSWLPMYGALADLLSREPESTDQQRTAYCMQRYELGLKAMKNSNWLLQATVDGVAVDTPALQEMDDYAPGWEASQMNLPALVQAGIDFLQPTPGLGQGISMTLVGNAPLLDATNTYVQVSRDDFVQILNYAQHVALFKQGGDYFASTLPLLKGFYEAAMAVNKRLLTYGIFSDTLKTEGQRQDVEVRR